MKVKAARKRAAESEPDEASATSAKKARWQQQVMTPTSWGTGTRLPQSKVDHLVMNFIIDYMEPMSVVEAPSFVELVTGLQPSATVMTRKTLDGM